jgi:hypothetical protein
MDLRHGRALARDPNQGRAEILTGCVGGVRACFRGL